MHRKITNYFKTIFLVIAAVLLLNTAESLAAHFLEPPTSSIIMHLAGFDFQIGGSPAQVGDEIAVFDSGNVLVGLFVVVTSGQYGDLPISGDISETIGIDEGANPGEALSIRVWDVSGSKEYQAPDVVLTIPSAPVEPYELPTALPITFSADTYVLLDVNVVCIANDTTCDGVDDDCDGTADEDYVPDVSCFLPGACSADNVASTCVAGAGTSCSTGTPAADDATCDGVDEDCDGVDDENYVATPTSCGVGACEASGTLTCVSGEVVDSCTEGDPAADDATCDGVDDDCDGVDDEDYVATPTSCGVGACEGSGTLSCIAGSEVDSCSAGTPAADDATCDGVDDDCDGVDDEDYVTDDSCFLPGACSAGNKASTCVAGAETPCSSGTPSSEVCDGSVDENCNGTVDEGCDCTNGNTRPTTCGVGACEATGIETCTNGTWGGDTCTPGEPSTEVCNGTDDDCDGRADGSDADIVPQTCGSTDVGACSLGSETCNDDGSWVGCTAVEPVEEICDNLDNDCDGTVDQGLVDTDDDGICDEIDLCTGDDASGDTDGDGICDELDLCTGDDATGDTDDDGICDEIDLCTGEDATGDTDGDTVCDGDDNCPSTPNPGQDDADGDEAGDDCDVCPNDRYKIETDTDTDGDGWIDCLDNAPLNPNKEQADYDGDGSGDAGEKGPNGNDDNYDGNNDGSPDWHQKNVASLFANLGPDYITLAAEEECELVDVKNIASDDVDDAPAEIGFPFGFFRFGVLKCFENLDPGSDILVTMHLPPNTNRPDAITVNDYLKYGPTPDNPEPHWYFFMYDEESGTGVEFFDDDIFMYFIDGERGDDKLSPDFDGIIIDAGAPAFVEGNEDPPTTPYNDKPLGCFIETLFSGFRKN